MSAYKLRRKYHCYSLSIAHGQKNLFDPAQHTSKFGTLGFYVGKRFYPASLKYSEVTNQYYYVANVFAPCDKMGPYLKSETCLLLRIFGFMDEYKNFTPMDRVPYEEQFR